MIARHALIFVALIVWGALLNAFYMVYAVLGIYLLGIDYEPMHRFMYYVCLALSAAATYVLTMKVWPKDEPKFTKSKTGVTATNSAPVVLPSEAAPAPPLVGSTAASIDPQGAAPSIETCPHCAVRVFRKADGTCPSCRKQLAVL